MLNLLEQAGIDANKIIGDTKETMPAFREGYVMATEPGTWIRMMKPVVYLRRKR